MKRVVPPFISPGGKGPWASQLIPAFPPHGAYAEPYAGGAGVFWRKPAVGQEILSDLDEEVYNVYDVIKCPNYGCLHDFDWTLESDRFAAYKASPSHPDPIERAARFLYLSRGSYMHKLEKCRDRACGVEMSVVPRNLDAQHARLQGVNVMQADALAVMQSYDKPGTFFYVDPPWPNYYHRWPDWVHANVGELVYTLDSLQHAQWLWDENTWYSRCGVAACSLESLCCGPHVA